MKITYFAWLKTKIGVDAEVLSLPGEVGDVAGLIAWLAARNERFAGAFAKPAALRVAINQAVVGLDHAVTDTDDIAIFPPVTGG